MKDLAMKPLQSGWDNTLCERAQSRLPADRSGKSITALSPNTFLVFV